ncbi:unnamed protein product [Rotaria magnacalcarata]|uniref:HAT C-terminal dimerisation domain-containing protein n=3 Tax=Rotaria magnacalcarata TaxID=392030 RepID=A0A815C6N9_9BILA|nr:unnamed protein product [Rotaria magnacalcarata]
MNLFEKKKKLADLIKNEDKSITFYKPKKAPKSSLVWESFNIVVINNVRQEMVCCEKCKQLLAYRQKDGTASLAKHKRSCQTTDNDIDTDNNSTKNLAKQTQVTEYYSSKKSHIVPKIIREKVKTACTEFTALDSRAFETVAGDGFIKMAQSIFDAGRHFSPTSSISVKEIIPAPVTISRHIDQIYENKKNELIRLSYCGLALRFITEDYKLHNFILGCILYDIDSQSANNIRLFVDAQLLSFGLTLNNKIFVVTDNENKMRAAFKEKCTRIGCSIHYLSKQLEHSFTSEEIDRTLVRCTEIQKLFDNVKKVVTHVRRTHRQVKLKQKLQLYSDTRFNGAFYMLNVFLNVFDDIGSVLSSGYIDYLTGVDKDLLEEVCQFLIVFDNAINQLSEEERPTMHQVLPIRQLLIDHCEVIFEDSSELKELKLFLGERIRSVWILQDQHYICTFLHPRLKRFDTAPHEKDIAFNLVKQELLARISTPSVTTDTASKAVATDGTVIIDSTAPVNSNNLLDRCFDKPRPITSSDATPVKELNDYMALVVADEQSDDILLFWKNHEKTFPTLSKIVRDFYAIPASNTIVERLFSASKNIVTDRRTSLAEAKLNKLLFLKKNLFTLREIKKDKLNKNAEQSKQKLFIPDGESIVIIEDVDSAISSPTIKRMKPNDDNDEDDGDLLYDIEHMYDSEESDNIFLNF